MNNKLYDFNKTFVDYDETPYTQKDAAGNDENLMLNKILSTGLKSLTKGNIIKIDDWARSLYTDGKLMLDQADRKELQKIVENEFTGMSIILKRQLLNVLDNPQEIKPDTNGTTADQT